MRCRFYPRPSNYNHPASVRFFSLLTGSIRADTRNVALRAMGPRQGQGRRANPGAGTAKADKRSTVADGIRGASSPPNPSLLSSLKSSKGRTGSRRPQGRRGPTIFSGGSTAALPFDFHGRQKKS